LDFHPAWSGILIWHEVLCRISADQNLCKPNGADAGGTFFTATHTEEHRINPVVRIESLYENAEDKIVSMDEVHKIRSFLAWNFSPPILIEALIIHATNHVSTRRATSKFLEEREIFKENDKWAIKSNTRTDIDNIKTYQ
jgi:hypothetical protein